MCELYAEIIIDNKCKETDRIFNYSIPESMLSTVKIGSRVLVPFGISNKKTEAYVVGLVNKVDVEKHKLKSILKLIDEEPVISKSLIELAKWLKEKYICYYVEALQTIIPSPVRLKSSFVIELCESVDIDKAIKGSNSEIFADIIEYLEANNGKAGLGELKQYFGDTKIDFQLRKLQDLGIIEKKQDIKNKVNKKLQKLVYLNEASIDKIPKNAIKQAELINALKGNPGISIDELRKLCENCDTALRALKSKNFITIIEKENYRAADSTTYADKRNELTRLQQNAISEILLNFNEGKNVLLHGVTGSGKTEVYLEIIEYYLKKEMDAIVLVPEISLTPQMIERFKGRFGEKIAVMHSNLSEGEKYDEWRKIKRGIVKVVVGARSAIFAPFSKLGIIIIDEEHENTYKSDIKPKYLTREVAEKRCQLEGAHLILGSATPSVETYYRTQTSELGLVKLPERVNKKPMPNVEIVDLREELKNGNKTIFSDKLTEEILSTLREKNQLILFLNRRGHSTFVSCRECGLVMKCPRCNISLTFHMKDNKLCCHYCGFERVNPTLCPKCSSKSIRYFGVGTQKLEKEFQTKFGVKDTLRMDADTTGRKHSHEAILRKFRNREANVLLGTQMISKGLDFPDVTLVGVITADTSLNLPDFRAAERTFQMIAQVSGRAGRGSKSGKVVVQTYSPEHYSLQYAKNHDYEGFYNQEIRLREELLYPPYAFLGSLLISGINEQQVIKSANQIGAFIMADSAYNVNIEMLGPAAAPLSKIKSRYRWQIILKSKQQDEIKRIILQILNSKDIDMGNNNISIDLNPYNML